MRARRPCYALLLAGLLAAPFTTCAADSRSAPAADPPAAGVVSDTLVRPFEWVRGEPGPWSSAELADRLARAGFRVRIVEAGDLTPDGLAPLRVLAIPGDHVYPERGRWGGPVLQAIAQWVRAGGVYIAPIGVSHFVARDIATGARDSGHFGPDPLGLSFTVQDGIGPLTLTGQGRAAGLPPAAGVQSSPIRALRHPARTAILAWDSRFQPAISAAPVGRGWVIHSSCGETMEPAYAEWWYAAAAAAARAAIAGRLVAYTHAETLRREGLAGVSLDELDRRAFRPGPSPLAGHPKAAALRPGAAALPSGPLRRSLDGVWEMAGRDPGKGSERQMLAAGPWSDAVPARVPGSVHTALLAAGRIPDPMVGLNADRAREASSREWWFRRTFARPRGAGRFRLAFDGVDYSCTVWLNGERIARHEGAFGGPTIDVTGLLQERNTLVVRLDPAPADWHTVLKTNVVYGWRYVNLPSLGIWRSVRLEQVAEVEVVDPFVAARDAALGIVDIAATLQGPKAGWRGTLTGVVSPDNFRGASHTFQLALRGAGSSPVHLRLRVPSPRLWWPVDLGPQNLYRLHIAFTPDGGGIPDRRETTFGIRTVTTRPLPGGPQASLYNWTFVINGRPVFLKGANWCLIDPLLRLDRARYERFLRLARLQHVQLLRVSGGGLLETDAFYDLCDRLGIMVYQEFPLTWQRTDALSPSVVDETAVRNVRRLRNRPSLLMWGGGSEHSGQGRTVEQIGRIVLEEDGTRPFRRTDPYGGSLRNDDVYWGGQPLDRNLSLVAPFISAFGLSSPPAIESILRYLPPGERGVWPPPPDGSFIRHTPTFSRRHLDIMTRYAREFADTSTMEGLVTGMQLAQATGIRHTLELARSRWPEATGVCYYKLTDVYPGCSWSTIDWYGVPKLAHYVIQDAYAPLAAVALFERLSAPAGRDWRIPVRLLDDAGRLRDGWSVEASAYDSDLRQVARSTWVGSGPVGRVHRLGELVVPAAGAASTPLLVVADVRESGRVLHRSWWWLNFAAKPGCLFGLPRTTLSVRRLPDAIAVRNTGPAPAVGVHWIYRAVSDRVIAEDGLFWLQPGEERIVPVSGPASAVRAAAWNADPAG
ncbi:MAG TPA: hypothetical protein VLH79_10995 [Chthonomonadales bacterium]|nr:hypothetical protein [Chthonomonadales bacterium]